MAAGKRQRKARRFVVKAPENEAVVVETNPTADAKAAWKDLVSRQSDAEWAAPVVTDDEGNESYPTGEITVRFKAAPSDDELQQFAADHGTTVARRNELQPAQAVLVPDEPRGTFLPEPCETIESDAEVEAAWPNTISRYRRS